jgi:4-amino-4-deoxy-L-arabinose transferase-like glycosyltransferase
MANESPLNTPIATRVTSTATARATADRSWATRAPFQAAAVAALLACYLVLGLSASCRKSQTCDEGAHLGGGVTYWALNDYRIQPENGNWPQRFCGLPVWLASYRLPTTDSTAWQDMSGFGEEFLYRSGNDADAMMLRGRVMTSVIGVALALLVYGWSRRLFGPLAGLVSLTLYAFSPTMLAHGFLVTSDIASALFFTAAVGSLWMLLHRLSVARLVTSWLVLSGLFLSKFSAPIIVPIGLALIAVRLTNRTPLIVGSGPGREIHGRVRQLAVFMGLLPLLVLAVALSIWASYGFRYSMFNPGLNPPDKPLAWNDVATKSALVNRVVDAGREYQLLPEAYLYGFAHVMCHSEARSAFLNGEYRLYGWRSFFPYCLMYKTSLSLFVMLGLAVAAAKMRRPGGSHEGAHGSPGLLYDIAPLLVLLGVYWLFAVTSHLNIGHRHLLPTYPAMFILAGMAAWWIYSPTNRLTRSDGTSPLPSDERAGRMVVTAMRLFVAGTLAATVVDGVWCWPHYLAHFNVLAGGPRNGYKHFVDSSLDWGQDLKEAKAWLEAHPTDSQNEQRLYFAYYGPASTDYYGIHTQQLPGFPPRFPSHSPRPLTGGTYLVSATMLDSAMLFNSGRWNQVYEGRWQNLRQNVQVYDELSKTAEGQQKLFAFQPEDQWKGMFKTYEDLRFGRLASFLRQREPDDEIGYSILVYRLTDEDIAQAIDGPPVELLAEPEWQTEYDRLNGKSDTPPLD